LCEQVLWQDQGRHDFVDHKIRSQDYNSLSSRFRWRALRRLNVCWCCHTACARALFVTYGAAAAGARCSATASRLRPCGYGQSAAPSRPPVLVRLVTKWLWRRRSQGACASRAAWCSVSTHQGEVFHMRTKPAVSFSGSD
jgi:hypothetical protein